MKRKPLSRLFPALLAFVMVLGCMGPALATDSKSVTRLEFVETLYAAAGSPAVDGPAPLFTDLRDSAAVKWAAVKDIVDGNGKGAFLPDSPITREQAAVILLNYCNATNRGPVGSWAVRIPYADLDKISPWASSAIMWNVIKKLIPVGEDNLFRPAAPLNSAEVQAVLTNLAGVKVNADSDIDAVAYMQGQLDEMYLGKFDPNYLKMVDITLAEAQETYDNNVTIESEYFMSLYQIDYPTDAFKVRLKDLYKQIYAKSSYTVVSSAQQPDGSYSVKVTVRPLDIIQLFDKAAPDVIDAFNAKYDKVDTEAMTDAEFDTWYETIYDPDYATILADLLESLIPKMGYLEEKSIVVQIAKDPTDGYYAITDDSMSNLDALMIDYE